MTIYEEMEQTLVEVDEEWKSFSDNAARFLLEKASVRATIDIAKSLSQIAKHLSAIRATGIPVETFRGGL